MGSGIFKRWFYLQQLFILWTSVKAESSSVSSFQRFFPSCPYSSITPAPPTPPLTCARRGPGIPALVDLDLIMGDGSIHEMVVECLRSSPWGELGSFLL